MREGIYNFGRLDKNSGTLDARNLEKEKIVKAQKEILKKGREKDSVIFMKDLCMNMEKPLLSIFMKKL